jgi:hypothetical protein
MCRRPSTKKTQFTAKLEGSSAKNPSTLALRGVLAGHPIQVLQLPFHVERLSVGSSVTDGSVDLL